MWHRQCRGMRQGHVHGECWVLPCSSSTKAPLYKRCVSLLFAIRNSNETAPQMCPTTCDADCQTCGPATLAKCQNKADGTECTGGGCSKGKCMVREVSMPFPVTFMLYDPWMANLCTVYRRCLMVAMMYCYFCVLCLRWLAAEIVQKYATPYNSNIAGDPYLQLTAAGPVATEDLVTNGMHLCSRGFCWISDSRAFEYPAVQAAARSAPCKLGALSAPTDTLQAACVRCAEMP